MSLFDWLTGKIECPRCGTGGAKEVNGQILCSNPTCSYFSRTMDENKAGMRESAAEPSQLAYAPSGAFPIASRSVPAGSVAVRYRDFRGQERTFMAQAGSAKYHRNHLSVKVAPKGVRIVLRRDRILNLGEVETTCPHPLAPGQEWPTPRERQVLNYHKKHRSTSPLYERIRAKYPNW